MKINSKKMAKGKVIMSTDYGHIALLKQGKIFQIGEIRDDFFVVKNNGQLIPCKTLIWDFYEDGVKDHIYFDQNGELLFCSLSDTRPDYILKIYSRLCKTNANLNTWCTILQSEFIVTELGF